MRTRLLGMGAIAALALVAASFSPARADEGMWLLNNPPTKLLKEKHGFEPSKDWLEKMQRSAVRFSTGGSGSIVSPQGLVMTNHHVGSDMLLKLSTTERNLLHSGFWAKTNADELKCPDLELNLLWSIEDVTDKVNADVKTGMTDAQAGDARRKAMSTIEAAATKDKGAKAQIVTLYQGARYHLYTYKVYTDVRLVFAPEEYIAFFGGDTDNFEFPRHNLDMCFFRIYEDGKPLKAQNYLNWSSNGAKEDELVFVFGHPGRTRRLYTAEHTKFLRDVQLPTMLDILWRREAQNRIFANRNAENARVVRDEFHSVQNSRKAYTGMLSAMQEPAFIKGKVEQDQKLKAAAGDKLSPGENPWDQIAQAQKTYAGFYDRYTVLNRAFAFSDLFHHAQTILRLSTELGKPSAERLREYRDSELDSVYLGLYSEAPISKELETERLASGLSLLAERFGQDDPITAQALGGLSPKARAEQIISGTKLFEIPARRSLVEGKAAALEKANDPLIALAKALDAEQLRLRKQYEDQVESVERSAYAKIAALKFAQDGESVYPDATFTLRMAFGKVRGYKENGTSVPAFTTLGGAFTRAKERAGQESFDLPESWIKRKDSVKLDTPFDFVCTADIIGGNSGSPVVNAKGEVVGLIFDGNIQSLGADVAYEDEQSRAVAVDSRGIIESLRSVYQAGPLADELTKR